jgi:hypothetical protein
VVKHHALLFVLGEPDPFVRLDLAFTALALSSAAAAINCLATRASSWPTKSLSVNSIEDRRISQVR